jgi:hypothetical protein
VDEDGQGAPVDSAPRPEGDRASSTSSSRRIARVASPRSRQAGRVATAAT